MGVARGKQEWVVPLEISIVYNLVILIKIIIIKITYTNYIRHIKNVLNLVSSNIDLMMTQWVGCSPRKLP